jgi:hypothetical protein
MSARSMMSMRAILTRDKNMSHSVETRDEFNQKSPPAWEIINPSLPCYAWSGPMGGRHAVTSGIMVLVVDMPGMIVPKSSDVIAGDRVIEVKNRQGESVLGRMEVDSVFLRTTHKEIRMKAYADVER